MDNLELIKDISGVNGAQYDQIAERLLNELAEFENEFAILADIEPRQLETKRNYCEGFNSETDDGKSTERRFCKCLYYTNNPALKSECGTCVLSNGQAKGCHAPIVGNFKVKYYEFVPTDKGNKVGNVDLVIEDENFIYLTEVKPAVGNSESLLRMFLEIETYYRVAINGKASKNYKEVIGDKPLRKAIMFFKDSPQHKDFVNNSKAINTKKLIELFGITVLCAEIKDGKVYITAIA